VDRQRHLKGLGLLTPAVDPWLPSSTQLELAGHARRSGAGSIARVRTSGSIRTDFVLQGGRNAPVELLVGSSLIISLNSFLDLFFASSTASRPYLRLSYIYPISLAGTEALARYISISAYLSPRVHHCI